jgi:photosystem II stability/assembly factor-like uncharacterized protein
MLCWPPEPIGTWEVVHLDRSGISGATFLDGCFWNDKDIEIASGGMGSSQMWIEEYQAGNISYGNILQSSDGGQKWRCANCIASSGGGWPPANRYELATLNVLGMACQDQRAYIHGEYPSGMADPNLHRVFSKTSASASWTAMSIQNTFPSGYGSRLRIANGRWFYGLEGGQIMIFEFTPDANTGHFNNQILIYQLPDPAITAMLLSMDINQNLALLTASIRPPSGNAKSILVYNTQDAKIPKGTTDFSKHWLSTQAISVQFEARSAIITDAKDLVVAGYNSTNQTEIWRSTDQGQTWNRIYRDPQLFHWAQFLRVDSNRIILMLRRASAGNSEGMLLESNDGGKNFSPIPTSKITGLALPQKQLPGLNKALLSPNRQSIVVLGDGIILRWTPPAP